MSIEVAVIAPSSGVQFLPFFVVFPFYDSKSHSNLIDPPLAAIAVSVVSRTIGCILDMIFLFYFSSVTTVV